MVSESPFGADAVAELYARGRPDHHAKTIQRVAALLPHAPVERAVDIACGTGMSTAALRAIARTVIGIDLVPAMVDVAVRSGGDVYAVAEAERLPFTSHTFDLVNVASAVHWFDQGAFVSEALRVLDRDGVIALTEHFFLGEMEDGESFTSWMRDGYAVRYPTPPRGRHLTVTDEVPSGLRLMGKDGWLDEIEMSHEQLVDYLLTQSNTITAVEAGRENRGEVRRWLATETHQFFEGDGTRVMRFWGSAACYRRDDPTPWH
jgi:SAM-dependent methyltransferase